MAYAASVALQHNIQDLINSTTTNIDPQILESADKKLDYLRSNLRELDSRRYGRLDIDAIRAVDAEIRNAVWKLEEEVDSYAFHQSLPPSDGFPKIPLADEKAVKQEIRSFLYIVTRLLSEFLRLLMHSWLNEEEEEEEEEEEDVYQSTATIELPDVSEKLIKTLVDGDRHEKNAVTLFGMAGIGKTHLARKIYQHPLIVQHFDSLVWVRVGQKRRSRDVIVDIVSQLEGKPQDFYLEDNEDNESGLDELLERSVGTRRCLIVLDDVWSGVPFSIRSLHWRTGMRVRVLLTTRLEHVNDFYGNENHHMRFLDKEESWSLLWQNVFGDEQSFPAELEKAGRKIAEKCEGLPLLILVIARLLGGVERTEEYWNKVADNKTTTFVDAYEKIAKVLFKSYDYLQQGEKACFLYLGVFPQTREIPVSKLCNLWTVERFFDRMEESYLMACLREIVSQSVVIVCKESYNYGMKTCKLHSAYWYLCVKEARKTKFLHVLNKLTDCSRENIQGQRRLSLQNNILFGIKEAHDSVAAAASKPRSLFCTGEDHEYPVHVPLDNDTMMFLKVLDAHSIRYYEFPTEVLKLLLLKYLALTHNGNLPPSISNLLHLQFLILRQHHNVKLVGNPSFLPKEIWDMQQLKHLQSTGHALPDPGHHGKLPKLSTLYVNAQSCTKAIFSSVHNLKKLGIVIELNPDAAQVLRCFEHIGILGGLESLKCVVVNPRLRSQVVAPPHHLSNLAWDSWTMKKLSLNGLGYPWRYMSALGSLLGLKVLKLRCCAFQGPKWETKAGQFKSLEFLLLEDMDLAEWTISTESWFSVLVRRMCDDTRRRGSIYNPNCLASLQRLTIRHCYKLKEIPLEFAGFPSLRRIEVVDCSPSVVASALQIQHKRPSLERVIDSSWL